MSRAAIVVVVLLLGGCARRPGLLDVPPPVGTSPDAAVEREEEAVSGAPEALPTADTAGATEAAAGADVEEPEGVVLTAPATMTVGP